jgi:pullulanase/glycogen debranching enzyme
VRASPVVYEAHVRGLAHTFDGIRQRLPYLSDLGIDVIELMPVHPFDTTRNYWGYMPIVWGAVHGPYAADADAPAELAALVAAAHLHGIHVWLDVVYNHTGEGDATQPTWTLRGLDDRHAYLRNARRHVQRRHRVRQRHRPVERRDPPVGPRVAAALRGPRDRRVPVRPRVDPHA